MGVPAVFAFAAAAVLAAPPSEGQAILRAHNDVRSALTSIHLLTTSIQGNLKSLEWDLGWWGKPEAKTAAGREFEAWTAAIGDFRKASEAIAAVNDPLREEKERLAQTPAVKRAAADIPTSISGKIAGIREMRAGYDADAARQALRRARGASKGLREAKRLHVNSAQRTILNRASALRASAAGIRKRLASILPIPKKDKTAGDRAGRRRVDERLALIEEDADALKTEIARLDLLFGLNNLLEKPE